MSGESEAEDFDELDTRFLEVCIDGDVEELIQLFEEIARAAETLEPNDLNCVDNSGRVSFRFSKCENPSAEKDSLLVLT